MGVQLGSERLLASSALDGLRVAIVCNPASVDHEPAEESIQITKELIAATFV